MVSIIEEAERKRAFTSYLKDAASLGLKYRQYETARVLRAGRQANIEALAAEAKEKQRRERAAERATTPGSTKSSTSRRRRRRRCCALDASITSTGSGVTESGSASVMPHSESLPELGRHEASECDEAEQGPPGEEITLDVLPEARMLDATDVTQPLAPIADAGSSDAESTTSSDAEDDADAQQVTDSNVDQLLAAGTVESVSQPEPEPESEPQPEAEPVHDPLHVQIPSYGPLPSPNWPVVSPVRLMPPRWAVGQDPDDSDLSAREEHAFEEAQRPMTSPIMESRAGYWRRMQHVNSNTWYDSKTPRSTMVQALSASNVIPEPLGLPKIICAPETINISHVHAGDEKLFALGCGMELVGGATEGKAIDAKLQGAGGAKVIDALCTVNILHLNLARNLFGPAATAALAAGLSRCCSLRSLNIDMNKLSDGPLATILSACAEYCNQLDTLRCNHNRMGPKSASHIAGMIARPPSPMWRGLEQLYISWCELSGKPALSVCAAIEKTVLLKYLDISFNNLRGCALVLGKSLKLNKTLQHLDVSFTMLTDADAAPLAQINQNRTLPGIHSLGNGVIIDSRGFFKPLQAFRQEQDDAMVFFDKFVCAEARTRLKTAFNVLPTTKAPQMRKEMLANAPMTLLHESAPETCWVCGKWRPFLFEWRIAISGPSARSIELVTSFDNWKPEPMLKRPSGVFDVSRMVPANVFYFGFIVDGVFRVAQNELYTKYDEIMAFHERPATVFVAGAHQRGPDGFLASGGYYLNYASSRLHDEAQRKQHRTGALDAIRAKRAAEAAARAHLAPPEPPKPPSPLKPEDEKDAQEHDLAYRDFHVKRGASVGLLRRAAASFAAATKHEGSVDDPDAIRVKALTNRLTRKARAVGAVAVAMSRTLPVIPPRTPANTPAAAASAWKSHTKYAKGFRWSVQDGILVALASECPPEKCFDLDWSYSKADVVVRDKAQRKAAAAVLRPVYGMLMAIFRHYSGDGDFRSQDLFSLGWLGFTKFCQEANLMDDKGFDLLRADTIFIAADRVNATNSASSSRKAQAQARNPRRALTRYEFLEAVLRTAVCKFPDASPDVACQRLVEEHLKPFSHRDDQVRFREKRLFTEEVDIVLRESAGILKQAYNLYTPPVQDAGRVVQLMAVQQWMQFMEECGIAVTPQSTEACKFCFIYALPRVQDELLSENFAKLDFDHFLEAVARVSDVTDADMPPALCQVLPDTIECITAQVNALKGRRPSLVAAAPVRRSSVSGPPVPS